MSSITDENNDFNHEVLLYLGDTLLGDFNKFAKNRSYSGDLYSETSSASAPTFQFDISYPKFREIVAKNFDDDPDTMLKMLKLRVVFVENSRVMFAGVLGSDPARSGAGSSQILTLKFYDHFWRLTGDLVCDPSNTNSPLREFDERPAHLFVEDLINESKARFAAAGETLNWDFGTVDTLANKTITYKDFETVAKALLDAMNNTEGAGKFDVTFRTDPKDFTHQFIDILAPRGKDKNITILFPSDGVYKLWAQDYSIDEDNDFASDIIVAGSGELGTPVEMANTPIAAVSNPDFAKNYGYFREYSSQSGLTTSTAVAENAATQLAQKSTDFAKKTPQIKLVGRAIEWLDASNDDNGLDLGDGFYFDDESQNGADQSGWYRIISLAIDWDDNGAATVTPTLQREK